MRKRECWFVYYVYIYIYFFFTNAVFLLWNCQVRETEIMICVLGFKKKRVFRARQMCNLCNIFTNNILVAGPSARRKKKWSAWLDGVKARVFGRNPKCNLFPLFCILAIPRLACKKWYRVVGQVVGA